MTMATATMAKKRTAPAPEPEHRRNLISIRGTQAWKDWLDRYAASRRLTVVSLIDVLLAEAAKRDGFEAPPER